jgi:hypothetical protein
LHSCIILPPVGHSSYHEYHYCQLRRQRSCVLNFYCTFKVFHLNVPRIYCFPTATVVTRTRHNISLPYIACLVDYWVWNSFVLLCLADLLCTFPFRDSRSFWTLRRVTKIILNEKRSSTLSRARCCNLRKMSARAVENELAGRVFVSV